MPMVNSENLKGKNIEVSFQCRQKRPRNVFTDPDELMLRMIMLRIKDFGAELKLI